MCVILSGWVKHEPRACNVIKREALVQMFSCEFCEIFKNTFLIENLQATASGNCYHKIETSVPIDSDYKIKPGAPFIYTQTHTHTHTLMLTRIYTQAHTSEVNIWCQTPIMELFVNLVNS